MANLRIKILFISLFVLYDSTAGQNEPECYESTAIYFKGLPCLLNPTTFYNLINNFALCDNIALLGFHQSSRKYFFLTVEFKIIGFEDESNIWMKKITNENITKNQFLALKSVLYKESISLLVICDKDYYLFDVHIGEIFYCNIHNLGSIYTVIPQLSCDNVYFIKAEKKALYFHKWPFAANRIIKFQQKFDKEITSLKLINPFKIEITTINGDFSHVTCAECLLRRIWKKNEKPWMAEDVKEGLEIHKTHEEEGKQNAVYVIDNNMSIIILLSLFAIFMIILMIALTVFCTVYFCRGEKKNNTVTVPELDKNNYYARNNYFPVNPQNPGDVFESKNDDVYFSTNNDSSTLADL